MNKFFDNLPKDVLGQTMKLFKNYNDAMQSKEKSKITDLFFLWTEETGFEFIHKNSWKGRWLALKTGIKRMIRAGDDSLNIENNLEKVAILLEKATKVTEDRFFKQLKEKNETSSDLDPREKVYALGVQLKVLREHIYNSRLEKGKIDEIPKDKTQIKLIAKVNQVSQEYFGDLTNFSVNTKKLLLEVFTDIENRNDDELNEVVCLLSSHVEAGAILENLKQGKTELLQIALMKGLAHVSDERSEKIRSILSKIQVKPKEMGSGTYDDQLTTFANQFGDAFIGNTDLEGNVSARPYTQLMSDYITNRKIQTPTALGIKYLLDHVIDLKDAKQTPEELEKEIRKIIAECPGEKKKCLLMGGWVGHRVVCEIELQTNGKYAFRFYNKGAGIELHDQLQGNYDTQYAGCMAIKDIPEKLLFKHSFFASMQEAAGMPSDGIPNGKDSKLTPMEFLAGHVFPMLGGEKEIIDERIQHFLNPQLSGTCTYASIQACMAHQMTSEEFNIFECDYKTFLLEHYHFQLVKSATTEVKSENDYHETRLHYAAIKRSLEEFSRFVDEKKSVIPDELIDLARLRIVESQAALVNLDQHLLNYEKTLYTSHLDKLQGSKINLNVKIEKNQKIKTEKKDLFDPEFLSKEATILLESLQKLKQSEGVEKLDIEDILGQINKYGDVNGSEGLYLCDCLFKHMGSLENWSKVKYKNPKVALPYLNNIASSISKSIASGQRNAAPENYLMYLFASYGIECAFNQCSPQETVLEMENQPSLLSAPHIQEYIKKLRCADPFWVSGILEIQKTRNEDKNYDNQLFFKVLLDPNKRKDSELVFSLNSNAVDDIWSWYEKDENKELREKVDNSIELDRKNQEIEIQKIIKTNEDNIVIYGKEIKDAEEELKKGDFDNNIDKYEKLLDQLKNEKSDKEDEHKEAENSRFKGNLIQLKKEVSDLEEKIDSSNTLITIYKRDQKKLKDKINQRKKDIDQCNLNIKGAPDLIHQDIKYWPWGFEDNLSKKSKATFFFANLPNFFKDKIKQDDILPAGFREYCKLCMYNNNIFHLTKEIPSLQNIDFTYKLDKNRRIDLEILTHSTVGSFSIEHKPFEYDPYYSKLVDDKNSLGDLYGKLFEKRTEEVNIPYQVAKDKVSSVPFDIAREIYALRSTSTMQVQSVLSYFQEHMEDLKDNRMVHLFHSLLFESNMLLSELENEETRKIVLPKLKSFFSAIVTNAMQLEEYDNAANLFWMASNVQSYLDFISKSPENKDKTPLKLFDDHTLMLELVKKGFSPMYSSQWPVFSEAILASCQNIFESSLDTEELNELFIYGSLAHITRNRYAIEKDNQCSVRAKQAEVAVTLLKKKLGDLVESKTIGSMEKALNDYGIPLLKEMYPSLVKGSFTIKKDSDLFKADDGSAIILSKGIIIPANPKALEVYDKPLQQGILTIFKHQKVYPDNFDLSKLRCFQLGDFTYIEDCENKFYLKVNGKTSVVSIKTPVMNFWCEHIPLQQRTYLEQNKELISKFAHRKSDDTLYFCDLVSHQPIYEASLSKNRVGVLKQRRANNEEDPLTLAKPTKDTTLFSSFEDPSCTSFWADYKGDIKQIDFSRLNITLKLEGSNTGFRWVFAEDKDWFLSSEQFAPHFGQRTGFLVFENEKGQKKVIFPVWGSILETKKALNYSYKYVFESDTVRQGRYVECNLVGNTLSPNSHEARFYLAKIYLEKGLVDDAEQLLHAHEAELTYRKFSEQEAKFLKEIAFDQVSGDIGARNLRLRMRALYLLEKNDSQFLVEKEDEIRLLKQQMKNDDKTQDEINKAVEEIHAKDLRFMAKEKKDNGLKLKLVFKYLSRLGEIFKIEPREELQVLSRVRLLNGNVEFEEQDLFMHQVNLAFSQIEMRIKELKGDSITAGVIVSNKPIISDVNVEYYIPTMHDEVRKITGYLFYILPRFLNNCVPEYFKNHFVNLFGYRHEIIEPKCVDEIDAYQPTLSDRIRYHYYRWSNTFPFNPHTVDGRGFKNYYRLLKIECLKSNNWKKARDRGLLQALYYMALFSKDPDVKKRSEALLKILLDNVGSSTRHLPFVGKNPVMPLSDVSSETRLVKGLQELVMLKVTPSVNEKNLLSNLSEEYFKTNRIDGAKINSDKIFNKNYPEAVDKTIKNKFKEISEDIEAADLSEDEYSLKDEKDLDALRNTLASELKIESRLLSEQEFAITNSVATALASDSISYMQFVSKKRSFPTIEELCMICARKNFNAHAIKLYPELSGKGRDSLKKSVVNYLKQKQLVQHLERCKKQTSDLMEAQKRGDEGITPQTMMNALGRSLDAKRCYDNIANKDIQPILMLMETILNIKLRQDQVDNIVKFAESAGKDQEIVLQMIMGAGKTSVLQPVLAYLLTLLYTDSDSLSTDNDKLSTVIVPESLFEPVKEGLAKALGSAFGQSVFFAPYERSLAKDLSYLQTFYDRISEAKDRGACLLLTPRQKHSIVTSLYEAYHEYGEKGTDINLQRLVELISKICDFMQIHEVDQIDEIDLVMNPKVIFKYPVGSKEIINQGRGSILSQMLINLADDKDISDQVSIDFIDAYQKRKDPKFVKKGACLTKERFSTIVQPKLVTIACDLFQQGDLQGPVFKELLKKDDKSFISHFLTQSTPHDAEIAEIYLPVEEAKETSKIKALGIKEIKKIKQPDINASKEEKGRWLIAQKIIYKQEMVSWIKENLKDKGYRDLLGVCSHAISKILPNSLFKECGSHYGEDPKEGNFVPRPYSAPKAPKKTMYGDPYEQAIFAAQLTLFSGPPRQAAKNILKQLQKDAKIEMKLSACALVETVAYKKFARVLGKRQVDFKFLEEPLSKKFIKAFQKAISRDSSAIQEFMLGYVFPQIALYPKSISSTPSTLAGSSRISCGYTGTLFTGILSRTMKALPEKGTDGKTITSVQKKMEDKESDVINVSEKNKGLCQQVKEMFLEDKDLYVMIDSGGWLKEENIDEYAEGLLSACENSKMRKEIKAIQYHDAKGTVISLEKDEYTGKMIKVLPDESKYKTTEGKVLTIIAQKFETGTNIPQKPNAKAYETIRKNMTLRDVLQSIFRMRQILYAQSASELLSDEVREHISISFVEALLMENEFKAIFAENSQLDKNAIDKAITKLDLPAEAVALKQALKTALLAYAAAKTENEKNGVSKTLRENISEFSKYFVESYHPDSDALWRYFAVNQARSEQDKSWVAGKQKMREVIEKPIRIALANNKLPVKDRYTLFKAFKNLLVQETADSPFDNMSQGIEYVEAKTAINSEIKKYDDMFKKLDEISEEMKNVVKANIEKLYGSEKSIKDILKTCVKEEDIADVVESPSYDDENELEVEVEEEVEIEKEEEKQIELEEEQVVGNLDQFKYKNMVKEVNGGYVMNEFFLSLEIKSLAYAYPKLLKTRLPENISLAYQDNIYCSSNLMNHTIGTREHGSYHLAGRYLLALFDPQAKLREYVLISHEDANLIKKGLYESSLSEGRHALLFDLNGDVAAGDLNSKQMFADEMHETVMAQAKLLTGKINFSNKEVDLLKKSIGENVSKGRALKELYENTIKYLPSKIKKYTGTYIYKMFRDFA